MVAKLTWIVVICYSRKENRLKTYFDLLKTVCSAGDGKKKDNGKEKVEPGWRSVHFKMKSGREFLGNIAGFMVIQAPPKQGIDICAGSQLSMIHHRSLERKPRGRSPAIPSLARDKSLKEALKECD